MKNHIVPSGEVFLFYSFWIKHSLRSTGSCLMGSQEMRLELIAEMRGRHWLLCRRAARGTGWGVPRTRETSAQSQRETRTCRGLPHPPPGAPQRESGLGEGPSPLQLGCSREQGGQLPATQRTRSAGRQAGPQECWGHAEVTLFLSEPGFPIPRNGQPCPMPLEGVAGKQRD